MIIFNFVKARCFSIISGKCARDRVCKMFSLEKREGKTNRNFKQFNQVGTIEYEN